MSPEPIDLDRLNAALDAYHATHSDREKCSAPDVRAIAAARDDDLSWTTVACVKAALEAVL